MIIITASNGKLIVPAHGSCIDVSEEDILDLSEPKNLSCTIEDYYSMSEYSIENPDGYDKLPDDE